MKKRILAVAALVAVFAAQGAGAKTLEDVLKEKGVITEADYKEVTKSKPFDYKLGKGFTLTSPNENFLLSIGGRMQFRYNFFDKDGAPNVSQWQSKRIKFYTSGYAYTKNLTYVFQADFVNASKPTLLDDANLNYRLIDELQIRFGQGKTPLVRQEIISDGNLQFVDRSPVADNFKHGRDTGAMLNGKFVQGLVYYSAGIFNGVGQSTLRSNTNITANDNAFVGRIVANPFGDVAYTEADLDYSPKPLLSIGFSFLSNTLRKNGATTFADVDATATSYFGKGWLGSGAGKFNASERVNINTYGADAVFKWVGFSAQGEYLLGHADGQTSGNTLRAQGYYVQTGYCIIPKKLETGFRYSFYDPDRDKTNNLLTEVAGGVSYYFEKHNLKLQADVANLHQQPARTDEIQYRLQAQITY